MVQAFRPGEKLLYHVPCGHTCSMLFLWRDQEREVEASESWRILEDGSYEGSFYGTLDAEVYNGRNYKGCRSVCFNRRGHGKRCASEKPPVILFSMAVAGYGKCEGIISGFCARMAQSTDRGVCWIQAGTGIPISSGTDGLLCMRSFLHQSFSFEYGSGSYYHHYGMVGGNLAAAVLWWPEPRSFSQT